TRRWLITSCRNIRRSSPGRHYPATSRCSNSACWIPPVSSNSSCSRRRLGESKFRTRTSPRNAWALSIRWQPWCSTTLRKSRSSAADGRRFEAPRRRRGRAGSASSALQDVFWPTVRRRAGTVPSVNVLDIIEYPQIRYADLSDDDIINRGLAGHPLPYGQYALVVVRGDSAYLARDPMGCNKLFFGWNGDNQLVAGSRAVQVWRRGVALAMIGSCPPGHVLEVSGGTARDRGGCDASSIAAEPSLSIS